MNLAWTVVIVMAVGWTLVSILVALAFGGMTRGRDEAPRDLVDLDRATAPPMRDDGYRTAV